VSDTARNAVGDRRDPVLEVGEHLQQALAALDQLREVLSGAPRPDRPDAS
jgi:hypothetical protein